MRGNSKIIQRNHAQAAGGDAQPMVLAHGFSTDQTAWHFQAARFTADYRLVTFATSRYTSPAPPSTTTTEPVTYPLAMQNSAAAATSSGRATRPRGRWA
jgi:pimeloyl-ACP methyl ester carboxylesterase